MTMTGQTGKIPEGSGTARLVNVAAMCVAGIVLIGVVVAGLVIGTAPDPTVAQHVGNLRITEDVAKELLLSESERERMMTMTDGVTVTSTRTNLSSAVLPDSVEPAACVGDLSVPSAIGGLTDAETGSEDAIAWLESSAIVFSTHEAAKEAFETHHDLWTSECATMDYASTITSLTSTLETEFSPIGESRTGYMFYDGSTELTFSDGFVQRGTLARYLVGNAVFLVANGMNQPLRDAPWGELPREVFEQRLDEFLVTEIDARSTGDG